MPAGTQSATTINKNYIGGAWLDGSRVVDDINPSNTKDVVGRYAHGDAAQVKAAVAAAKAAFPAWSRSNIQLRHDILKRVGDEIMARKDELGPSAFPGRRQDDSRGRRRGHACRRRYSCSSPVSVCASRARRSPRCGPASTSRSRASRSASSASSRRGTSPWRFPAWKTAPALAYGNCVVLKPAELVPAMAFALAEIISRAGAPPGVFNLVMGRGSEVGQAMLEHKDIAAISFTGSVATGRRIAAACIASDPMKKVQLEMGGKNPMVVLDDADLKVAAECAVNCAFFSTGQRCTASSRLIVTEGIHDKFVAAVTERMRGLVVDDALKQGTQIGPVVDPTQLEQDLSYIRIGQEEGAKLVAGGERLNRENPGFYLAPALFTEASNRMRIASEEIFGPVAAVIRAKDYDEALDIANDTEFGLTAGICTTSLKYASHFKRNAEAGMVMVNLPTAGVDYHVPFGGRKGSSYGPREQGRYAQEFYTIVKTAYTFDLNEPYVPKAKGSE